MTQEQGTGVAAKIQELKSEHRALDEELQNMANDPTFDDLQMRRLKKRKLFLKDNITLLEGRLVPDITAWSDDLDDTKKPPNLGAFCFVIGLIAIVVGFIGTVFVYVDVSGLLVIELRKFCANFF